MLQYFTVGKNAYVTDFVRCYTSSGTHIRKELLVATAVIFVAHPINKGIQTAADKHQNSQRVMQLRVEPRFPRHRQGVVDLIWRERDHQHVVGYTDHPRHFPAHFGLVCCRSNRSHVNFVNNMRKQTEHFETREDNF